MILHLPADRKSMLADILGRWTHMPVTEAHDGDLIEPNHVYVPPPHAVVTVKGGRLGIRLNSPDDIQIPRPIDAFFDSLGSAVGDQAVGIVLSGTGSDGALGLKAIKECGGLTIAQGSGGERTAIFRNAGPAPLPRARLILSLPSRIYPDICCALKASPHRSRIPPMIRNRRLIPRGSGFARSCERK